MSTINTNSNSILPDRLYGEHYPDAFLDVLKPLRVSNVATLGDYIRQLQESDKQSYEPNKSCVACQPNKPSESNFDHICPNNPILTCNCVDPKYCAELGADAADGEPNKHGWFKCPVSGLPCNTDTCPNGCQEQSKRVKLYQEHQSAIDTERKNAVRSWPCVVVGAIPETWIDPAKCISGLEHSEGDTERDTNARPESDGSYVSTNH